MHWKRAQIRVFKTQRIVFPSLPQALRETQQQAQTVAVERTKVEAQRKQAAETRRAKREQRKAEADTGRKLALRQTAAARASFSFFVLGLPHVTTLIELRIALVSYQDYHMLLLTLAGLRATGSGAAEAAGG